MQKRFSYTLLRTVGSQNIIAYAQANMVILIQKNIEDRLNFKTATYYGFQSWYELERSYFFPMAE